MNFLSLNHIRDLPLYSPTFVTAIPGILKIVGNLDLTNLRFIRSASAAMPTTLYHALAHKFQVPVLEAFGMTEALSHCFTNPLHGEQRPGTVGMPSGIDAKIQNQHLMIKGPCVCHDDWYDTGDLAQLDQHGYYKIIGRHRDQINVNGYKINPISVENQLLSTIPGLETCVVFGSTRLKCLYTGACSPDLIQHRLISINRHCRAVLIQQVDSIPTQDTGKISRTWLETQYQ